jgi:N-acetyl-gamma-glutamyl-phosphate reductase
VGRHQHTPEIEQMLDPDGGVRISLTTQLLPVARGILSACHVMLERPVTVEEVYQFYQDCYAAEPFVHVLPPGQVPQLKHVRGSNHCDIAIAVDERTGLLQVFSVIDNLQKGAAGQAVQNFNVMHGFAETEGLWAQPMYP